MLWYVKKTISRKSNIQKNNIDFIYVNQIGANDELVFNGFSRIYNKNSKIIACAKNFEEDLLFIDFNSTNTIDFIEELTIPIQENFSLDYKNDLKRTYNSLVLSIKDYFSKNGFKRAVLGLSGGLDSTICAVLLADALGSENVLGISIPSKLTSSESKNDAKELAQNLKINFIETPIKDMQDILGEKFNKNFKEITLLLNKSLNSFSSICFSHFCHIKLFCFNVLIYLICLQYII